QLVSEAARQIFDLSTGPLLDARLLRLGPEDHVVTITMHHIVSDGWSIGVFYRELTTLYEAFALDQPLSLPELPIQYADYAVWQRQWFEGDLLRKQLDYWKTQLSSAPMVLDLPTDKLRPIAQTFRGDTLSARLTPELTAALKALSRRERVTLFMTLLAAFQTLLSRYTGQQDIVVGSPIANRNHRATEKLIGFFVNTL